MTEERWTKKEVLAHFRVRSWATVWRWQKLLGFPIGFSIGGGGARLLFDADAIRAWEKKQTSPQFVKGVSTGPRPKYNLPLPISKKVLADADA